MLWHDVSSCECSKSIQKIENGLVFRLYKVSLVMHLYMYVCGFCTLFLYCTPYYCTTISCTTKHYDICISFQMTRNDFERYIILNGNYHIFILTISPPSVSGPWLCSPLSLLSLLPYATSLYSLIHLALCFRHFGLSLLHLVVHWYCRKALVTPQELPCQ